MTDFNEMIEALIACDKNRLVELVNSAIGRDVPPSDILNKGLIAGMDIAGENHGGRITRDPGLCHGIPGTVNQLHQPGKRPF